MGLAATLQALSNSVMGTGAARFIGGMSQGTFSSTVPLYYTYWYTREEMAFRMTLYVGVGASLGTFFLRYWVDCRCFLNICCVRSKFN